MRKRYSKEFRDDVVAAAEPIDEVSFRRLRPCKSFDTAHSQPLMAEGTRPVSSWTHQGCLRTRC